MIAIVGLLVFILCLAGIIVIQYLMLRMIKRGRVVRSHTSFNEHPNCRCIPAYVLNRETVRAPSQDLDPRIWNPNASAWMHSGPGGTIDLDAMPVKK